MSMYSAPLSVGSSPSKLAPLVQITHTTALENSFLNVPPAPAPKEPEPIISSIHQTPLYSPAPNWATVAQKNIQKYPQSVHGQGGVTRELSFQERMRNLMNP
mmetsp:Transcript_60381/g.91032  ORF Transcript_60381/g.91032 Transcript_60381/m.91032 type:complete len:102 (-) Transcript_60381:33-338(-)